MSHEGPTVLPHLYATRRGAWSTKLGMCGILGIVNPQPADRVSFQAGLDAISHRGPDGEGRFESDRIVFGHRRLAVIDLSHAGDQPMEDPASGAVIIFNGEIYNYIEVRRDLEAAGVVFRTHSDTEVLLQAYLRWGMEMLPRLNGMWAFAIWDPRSLRLLVSRDRFGVKPFYYTQVGDTLMFGSEPKALLTLSPALAQPDARTIGAFFATNDIHAGEETFYRDVKALPAGSWACFEADTPGPLIPQTFWTYPRPDPGRSGALDFDELFEQAIALRLRSDVPVGLTLSGGLDSTAVLIASTKLSGRPLQCFTSVYASASRGEEQWARTAAAAVSAPLTTVESDPARWQTTLEKAVYHLDAPSYSPAITPLWAIMHQAREAGIPVLLEGQGADELLGGYSRYSLGLMGQMAARASVTDIPGELANLSRVFGLAPLVQGAVRSAAPWAQKLWSDSRGGRSLLNDNVPTTDSVRDSADLFAQLHHDHSRAILPALLHYGDAIAMAHGIESRLPFMDYRLVEAVFRQRPRLAPQGLTKAPIRSYLNRNSLPEIGSRLDKQGYPTPIQAWFQGSGGAMVRDVIASPNDDTWSWLQPDRVKVTLDRAAMGDRSALFQMFKVATTMLWLRNVAAKRVAV